MPDELPPLSIDDFNKLKDWLKEQREEGQHCQPPPQGDYQWGGCYFFNGGFGEYQPLFLKGKKIGGMFAPGSSFPNEYHQFDEHGGVYGKKSEPPVPHLLPIKPAKEQPG